MIVYSPTDFKVFQRRDQNRGDILISGKIVSPGKRLLGRITGKSLEGDYDSDWFEIPRQNTGDGFVYTRSCPSGGWYRLDLSLENRGGSRKMFVQHFGVGEIFLGAGQSNSTNYGDSRLKQETGMVSSFDGLLWRLADDPQEGVHDHSEGGSFWPRFGDEMYRRFHVPIGIASTGHGGTAIWQWKPGGELHGWLMTRVGQFPPGGFRAILWHQGESDSFAGYREYYQRMKEIIKDTRRMAGWPVPWFVALATYWNPEKTHDPVIREQQEKIVRDGFAFQGPDTDELGPSCRDMEGRGIHMNSDGLIRHGLMWAESVTPWLP